MEKLPFPAGPVLLLALLTCCTSSPSIVADPRTGETASCEITALSQALAEEVASFCQQNYEAAGWVTVPGPLAHTARSVGL
jgi:hypothetical protein